MWLIDIVGAGVISMLRIGRFGPKQLPDPCDIGDTIAVSEEAVVTDAVLAFGQDVDQEPADKLCRIQRHGGVATRAFKTVVFDAEGDAALVHTD